MVLPTTSSAHYALALYATLIEVGRLAPWSLNQFNLDALALMRLIEQLVGERLGVEENNLQAYRLQAVHSEAKAGAL